MDENFILNDRVQKIRQIVMKYGIENFYISFSGGKDSTVLSFLVDLAIPRNEIPRVYADTGIEYNMVRNFVKSITEKDKRFIIIKPTVRIKEMLETEGYPFKSKSHSEALRRFQKSGRITCVKQYLGERTDKEPWSSFKSCPKILKYQFDNDFTLKISDRCCKRLKEDPIKIWSKENKKPYGMVGIMVEEGGRRTSAKCLRFNSTGKLKNFQPLVPITKEWEEWYIKEYGVEICDIYKEPYNFTRTGCKGCPFAINLQHELDIMSQYFPNEKKQCEIIWEPVYTEYRRLGYRLNKTL